MLPRRSTVGVYCLVFAHALIGSYLFKVTNANGTKSWIVDLKSSPPTVGLADNDTADCTVSVSDDDYVALARGKANGQQLFMQGKLKISGNMALAMKLDQLMKQQASL